MIAGRNLGDGIRAFQSGRRKKAERIFSRIARHGSAAACWNLYVLHCGGGEAEWAQAQCWLRLAAERKHPEAQFELGVRLALGDGLPSDAAEAARLLQAAWEGGIDEASFNLALLYAGYYGGLNPEADRELAYSWMSVAALSGIAEAEDVCYRLAARLGEEQLRQAARRGSELWTGRGGPVRATVTVAHRPPAGHEAGESGPAPRRGGAGWKNGDRQRNPATTVPLVPAAGGCGISKPVPVLPNPAGGVNRIFWGGHAVQTPASRVAASGPAWLGPARTVQVLCQTH